VSTIDWTLPQGADIPIEERAEEEVLWTRGRTLAGTIESVLVAPEGVAAANPAFDVTPARLITGIITERGVCEASGDGLRRRYPEIAG
jgi:methylthioribose-1-phosphate isomerase